MLMRVPSWNLKAAASPTSSSSLRLYLCAAFEEDGRSHVEETWDLNRQVLQGRSAYGVREYRCAIGWTGEINERKVD